MHSEIKGDSTFMTQKETPVVVAGVPKMLN
jgi:hypothetical protein